eukprot:CAMPEP_0201911936 /NCGR_PEP_ID=MMETSP0903-20130614/2732_1 /ASSEMBLY_ACC=CAM_ASM_000552 /TAXON_ID=420261 /ORGANISM="Thalassiosira antarctica, Strain CCMP982" /LENGTH=749 /DNA_ID=CAMNT_0048446767 /DNA_START=189 /DNA_END=2438 /DNA_ORIENTATION=+
MKQRQNIRKSAGAADTPTSAQQGQPSSSPRSSPSVSGSNTNTNTNNNAPSSSSSPSTRNNSKPDPKTFLGWIHSERESITWILACAALGALLGFGVGAGWLTRGSGSYQYLVKEKRILGAMSAKTGYVPKRAMKHFVVSAWRVDLAKRIRKTSIHQLFTFKKTPWRFVFDFCWGIFFSQKTRPNQHWIAASPLWPPNWILFREVDLSQIDVGEGGLSNIFVSSLSFILPWRRGLIRALARKDRVKVNLRDQDGNAIEPKLTSSFSTSLLSSAHTTQPINPYYHPMAFHTLREYVIRFDNGYVHPDLGFLVPAPSGAERGLGMVRDTFNKCQVHCYPGTAEEKLKAEREDQSLVDEKRRQEIAERELMEEMKKEFPEMASSIAAVAAPSPASSGDRESLTPQLTPQQQTQPVNTSPDPVRNTTTYEGIQTAVHLQSQTSSARPYTQSEILLRIPLEAQITRKTALETLLGLLPPEQNGRSSHLEELDDAFVLALYLAHERGLGINSRIWPYIATLPLRPTCALHWGWRQSVVDVVTAMSVEMGTDVQGWPNEISKAAEMSERIVVTLSRASGETLATRPGVEDVTENIRWALCQVASRAVAGRESYGSLRLVPVMDMMNHDEAAGKFVEVIGKERIEDGSFIDANENEAGTFIVRSQRHGERKPLKRGQELMANYNVPAYSPLDWFLNMGYIPPERAGKWTMLEAGLPPIYRGGFSRKSNTVVKDSGAFGSGKPEIQVIRQHTQQQSCSR